MIISKIKERFVWYREQCNLGRYFVFVIFLIILVVPIANFLSFGKEIFFWVWYVNFSVLYLYQFPVFYDEIFRKHEK